MPMEKGGRECAEIIGSASCIVWIDSALSGPNGKHQYIDIKVLPKRLKTYYA
jgi:hypothetical protein